MEMQNIKGEQELGEFTYFSVSLCLRASVLKNYQY